MRPPSAEFQVRTTDDVASLPSVSAADRWDLPEVPGVYFVIRGNGAVAYVGEAWVSIRRRLLSHKKVRPLYEESNTRIAWMVCKDDGERHLAEAFAIGQLHPDLNVHYRVKPRRPRPE